jgi:hypothetical protein
MSDDLTFGVRMDGSGSLASEAKAARDELASLKSAADDLAASSANMASVNGENWAEVQRAANASAQAWLNGNAATDAAADKA